MKIVRTKSGENDFRLEGLTLGKLIAIQYAFDLEKNMYELGPIGEEILTFLQRRKLEDVDCFGHEKVLK